MPRYRLLAIIVLLLLPILVFHRCLFLGEAFVPADLLSYLFPWKALHPPTQDSLPWNVLRFDGITQFYPWRIEAARQLRTGQIPFWNSHQFVANGGTPLLANSQSAPLYPLHLLFALAPPDKIEYVFGLVAALHMGIAGSGLYRLLRACSLRRGACLLGAATWTLSAPVISWLSLPSFLGVVCWLPWLLLLVRKSHTQAGKTAGRLAILGAGILAGILILAGHLQIALYALLAALLYALWLGLPALRAQAVSWPRWVGGIGLAAALAVALSAPQVFPALELSKISHRAVTHKDIALYNANNASALPSRSLVTFLAPDFYGHPNQGIHWNNSNLRDASGHFGNNYTEWAVYIGVLPLLLMVFALTTPWRGDKGFFGLLAVFTLLIATGTPLNLVLFYTVPGYASLANPARILVVFAMAASALAAFGAEALLDNTLSAVGKRRGILIAVTLPVLVCAWGASLGANWAREAAAQIPFSQLMSQALPGLQVGMVWLILAVALCLALPRFASRPKQAPLLLICCIVLTIADLMFWGYGYNPSAKRQDVYPVTPGIAWLQKNAPQARIGVINRDWTLGQAAPQFAVLPPNSLTVYGLHDIGGYDSLFPKIAKEQIKAAGNGEDASPPANGNLVFVKRLQTAVNLGAEYIVFAPGQQIDTSGLSEVYRGSDLIILQSSVPPKNMTGQAVENRSVPISFRYGLFLALCGVSGISALLTVLRFSPTSNVKLS